MLINKGQTPALGSICSSRFSAEVVPCEDVRFLEPTTRTAENSRVQFRKYQPKYSSGSKSDLMGLR